MPEPVLIYLYDVINRSKRGMWIAAEDKVDAAVIAHDLKHTQEIENAQVEGPLPVKDGGLQAMLDAGRRGHLGYELPHIDFIEKFPLERPEGLVFIRLPRDVLAGRGSSGTWFFIKEF